MDKKSVYFYRILAMIFLPGTGKGDPANLKIILDREPAFEDVENVDRQDR